MINLRDTLAFTLNVKTFVRILLNDPKARQEITEAIDAGPCAATEKLGACNFAASASDPAVWYTVFAASALDAVSLQDGFLTRNGSGERVSMRMRKQTPQQEQPQSAKPTTLANPPTVPTMPTQRTQPVQPAQPPTLNTDSMTPAEADALLAMAGTTADEVLASAGAPDTPIPEIAIDEPFAETPATAQLPPPPSSGFESTSAGGGSIVDYVANLGTKGPVADCEQSTYGPIQEAQTRAEFVAAAEALGAQVIDLAKVDADLEAEIIETKPTELPTV